jgi:hypothetical protein
MVQLTNMVGRLIMVSAGTWGCDVRGSGERFNPTSGDAFIMAPGDVPPVLKSRGSVEIETEIAGPAALSSIDRTALPYSQSSYAEADGRVTPGQKISLICGLRWPAQSPDKARWWLKFYLPFKPLE